MQPPHPYHDHDRESEEHPHHHSEDEEHHHDHDDDIRSISLTDDRPLDLKKVEAWLSEIINTMGERLYRSKGILYIKGEPKRVVFQGVQTMFEARPDRFWNVNEKRSNQMVFIGKDLDDARIRAGFENCTTG